MYETLIKHGTFIHVGGKNKVDINDSQNGLMCLDCSSLTTGQDGSESTVTAVWSGTRANCSCDQGVFGRAKDSLLFFKTLFF